LVRALASNLDARHRLAGIHDRADDDLNRIGKSRHAVSNRAPEMVLDGYSADLGKTLVDLQIAADGREAGEANWRRVVDQLQGGLLREQHDGR
jgi:hypothetical protein